MHNSQDGALVDSLHATGNAYLLKAASATDQCLSCHANYGQFFGGNGQGPGGDFYWLTKTWTWTAHGTHTSTGDSHGHNVISPANNIIADAKLTTAPGGGANAYQSSGMGCTSCHDPHGNQNFRLLYDSSLGPIHPNGTGRFNFTEDAPLAFGNSRRTYIGSGGEETDAQHTIYKSGMSEWCGNCHGNFHDPNTTNYVHPTSFALGSIALTYDNYVSTDNMNTPHHATAYWGIVPFENVDADTTLDPQNETAGPAQNDQVMCLTCHRAHASAFSDIARWDMGATFIAESHPDGADGSSATDVANSYYQYTFVHNQRSLCNKCHAKDFNDGPNPNP